MASDASFNAQEQGFPECTLTVKQSIWAWLWWVVPWVVVGIVLFAIYRDYFLLVMPFVLGPLASLPRFFAWRSTLYIVTNDALVFQRGNMGGSQRYSIPATHLRSITQRPGVFGVILGYRAVDVKLARGRLTLSFMPSGAKLAERLEQIRLANPPGPDDEMAEPDWPADTPPEKAEAPQEPEKKD
ncbi:MAG: hypothetical protein FJ317_05290 [SAR202 cluster bacterium]|nr:hypothetical protein [SAR202 cluster bacterium]